MSLYDIVFNNVDGTPSAPLTTDVQTSPAISVGEGETTPSMPAPGATANEIQQTDPYGSTKTPTSSAAANIGAGLKNIGTAVSSNVNNTLQADANEKPAVNQPALGQLTPLANKPMYNTIFGQ